MPRSPLDAPASKLNETIFREHQPRNEAIPFAETGPSDRDITALIRRWETDDQQFARAMRADQPVPIAMDALAVRLCHFDRNTEAAELLCAAVMLAPANVSILNNLAVVLERLDRTADAVACVERSLQLSPAQPDSWIFLATLKNKQADLTAAQRAYETSLQLRPIDPLAWQGLGLILKDQHKPAEAIACLLKCVEQSHITAPLLAILGQLFHTTGQFEKSLAAYSAALDNDPSNVIYQTTRNELQFICSVLRGDDISAALLAHGSTDHSADDLLHKAFALLSAYGNRSAAIRVAEKRLSLFPDSPTADYLLRAIREDASIARSPDAYLIESFNRHADRFDDHLTKMLGYDIPSKLGEAVWRLISAGQRVDLLDAGCGTGLCGPWVRSFAATLTGVDIAPKMLERAAERNIYNRLVCAELTEFLAISPNMFEVIIAADVLIYMGDLTPLAAALATALRPGGLFAFSIELIDAGYRFLPSGRFAHARSYIRGQFAAHFDEMVCEESSIRLEGTTKVPGCIFVFRRH
jgi:predicted TPR repeat methyltransferase